MSNGGIKISTTQLKNDSQKIYELNESIPVLLKELETSFDGLSACWEGPAWSSYQENVARYIEILSEVYKNMVGYTSNLSKASEIYHRAEQDVCAKFRGIFIW